MSPTLTPSPIAALNVAATPAGQTVRGALLLAFALGSAGAQATTLNTAQLGVAPNSAGGSGPYSGLDSRNGPASLAGAATGGANSSGAGTVFVNWGVVKLTGSAFGSLNTVARGIFRDEVVITAPGIPNGTAGMVTYAVSVNGSLFTDEPGTARASWAINTDLNGGAFDLGAGGSLTNGLYAGSPFGTFTATVPFGFGATLPLYVQLEASAQAGYNGSQGLPNASFDLGQSLYWGGIIGITVNGAPVSGFNVSSASGTDYRNSMAPVPEPGALGLMLAGLGVLVGLQRRRRR
jgi:PEP-CTERM motif